MQGHLACRGDPSGVGLGGWHEDWVLLESLLRRGLCERERGGQRVWMGEAMIVGRVVPESSCSPITFWVVFDEC